MLWFWINDIIYAHYFFTIDAFSDNFFIPTITGVSIFIGSIFAILLILSYTFNSLVLVDALHLKNKTPAVLITIGYIIPICSVIGLFLLKKNIKIENDPSQEHRISSLFDDRETTEKIDFEEDNKE